MTKYSAGTSLLLLFSLLLLSVPAAEKPLPYVGKVAQYLSCDAMKGRGCGSPEQVIAAKFVAKTMQDLKLTGGMPDGKYLQPLNAKKVKGVKPCPDSNIIGVLPGKGPLAKECVVVMAHIDGYGVHPKTKEIRNGADDNASGVAVLLEIARQLYGRKEPLPRSVVFLVTTAEEHGMHGAKYYVANPTFPLDKTLAVLNFDMVGRLGDRRMFIYSADTASFFVNEIKRANTAKPPISLLPSNVTGMSDHQIFLGKKVPAIHFFAGFHQDYHKPTDDFEKLDVDGMQRIADMATRMVINLARLKKSKPEASESTSTTTSVKATRYHRPVEKLTPAETALLEKIQRETFRYFWEFGEPNSGMARERSEFKTTVASGASGFGAVAMAVAVERGWITRQQAVERLLKMLTFLEKAERFHGAWSHWIDGRTGKAVRFSKYDDGGDIVETALMMQGFLAVAEYFDRATPEEKKLREIVQRLWRSIDWSWFTQGQDVFYWHWSPKHGFGKTMRVVGWNECLILYVLAASSPTHPIKPEVYHEGWARKGRIENQSANPPIRQRSTNMTSVSRLGSVLGVGLSSLRTTPFFFLTHVV